MKIQTSAEKLAEIEYRSLIVQKHYKNKQVLENEPTLSEFKKIISPKLKESQKIFKDLQKKGVVLSPYLEVGSEHCLRPMILENSFNSHGFASDISFYSLKSAPKYAEIFKFKKLPQIICADAYNLPFKSNSFPFVFIYETLHHFPDPKPILVELKRVLAPGGHLLIGADPIKAQFQISLWRRPNKLRFWEKFLKFLLILPFISQIGKSETDYGVIETAFSVKTWQDSLSIFDKVDAQINVFPFNLLEKVTKTFKVSTKTKIGLFLFGGGISALCIKSGKKARKKTYKNIIICPNCKKKYQKEISMLKRPEDFFCKNCRITYPPLEKVPLLVEKVLMEKIKTHQWSQ